MCICASWIGTHFPLSHRARVVGSTPRRAAKRFCVIPFRHLYALILSPSDSASGGGEYPRNRITAGMDRRVGLVRFFSQLVTVVVSTPTSLATSFCNSPRSSLRFRIWSPIVLSSFGYARFGGFRALRVIWQKGNARVPVRTLR